MNSICCATGYSFFDVWAIVHFCFWIFVGSTLWAYKAKIMKLISFISCMILAFSWEVYEYFMAPRHPEIWRDPESFWNSWISDPLMCAIAFFGIWWMLDHRKRK